MPSTVLQAFPKGTRVRLNEQGMKFLIREKNRSGLITGHSRDGRCCYVRWDGRKSASAYSRTFLIPDPR